MPERGTRARHRPWVQASYGPAENQVGFDYLGGGGEIYPPQGFVVTRDGKLLVLDSNKFRLIWYDAAGRIERTLPFKGLEMPADVAVAADGTIIIADYAGVQTKGILLLNPDGAKKFEYPQIQTGDMLGLYAVGNEFFFDTGFASIKGGDTSGSASDEAQNVYMQDGNVIPGLVAPDGRTVVNANVDDEEAGHLFVTAMRGNPPEHVFSRAFQWPVKPGVHWGIDWVQSDAAGRIYVVLGEDVLRMNYLLCLDPNGNPVGMTQWDYPINNKQGTAFREYTVADSGGLVFMQQVDNKGVRYDWYDCH